MPSTDKIPYVLGIIGQKPYAIGGHDYDEDNRIRLRFRGSIQKIIRNHMRNHELVMGLTSLSLGLDHDFAEICVATGIDYEVYIPFSNYEDLWSKMPQETIDYHQELIKNSLNHLYISEGKYAPRKIIRCHKLIIKDADAVIICQGHPSNLTNYYIEYATKLSKPIFLLKNEN